MSNTIIEKIDAREDKDKTWRLSDSQSGHYLNVIFDRDLEEGMKVKRNFSFNRFESEQINELTKLVPHLTSDYSISIDSNAVGLAFMPVANCDAKSMMVEIS